MTRTPLFIAIVNHGHSTEVSPPLPVDESKRWAYGVCANTGGKFDGLVSVDAAPDLLAAVRLFMAAFHGTNPDAIEDTDPETAAALRAGRAAIEKAESA